MKSQKNKRSFLEIVQDKLLMKEIIATIFLLLSILPINTLVNWYLLRPVHQVSDIQYYFSIFPETLKENGIVALILCLICLIRWAYYFVYRPKLNIKGEKGNADFANDKIKKLKHNKKALLEGERLVRIPFNEESPERRGIILTTDNKNYYVDPNTTHNLILGITGSGKSQTSVFPFIDLISRIPPKGSKDDLLQESMIVNDPKGELCSSMASLLKERGYEVKIINLEEPYYSDSYDPFKIIKEAYTNAFTETADVQGDVSEAANLINAFSLILNNDPSTMDKFWQTTAKDLTNGIIMALMEDLVPTNSHLATPYVMRTVLSEFANTVTDEGERKLDWYFGEREIGNRAKSMASSAISSSDKTKESIISYTLAALSLFSDDGIAKMTSQNTIEFRDIIEKPTAIFLVCPDDDQTRWNLASIFIEQSYYAISKMIKRDYQGESPRRINYILDEFAQMPAIPDMHVKLSMSRSRNIRWTLYLQDFSQLEVKYDRNAGIIKNNCTNTIYLLSTDIKTVQEIQERLDNKTVVIQSVSARSGDLDSNMTQNADTQPLMYRSELLKMPFEEGVILRAGKEPIKAQFRAAFRYMNLQRKGMRELVPQKAEHASLDLSSYMDYLRGDNSLEIYRPNNQKKLEALVASAISGCAKKK